MIYIYIRNYNTYVCIYNGSISGYTCFLMDVRSPVVPVIFFPVTPLWRIKMPSQVKIIKKWMSQGWGSGKQMLEPGKQD